ncbi:alpha/beta fold hydrolase [Pseudomonas aeruginosa]|nr:alpha/beta fold hydrolase [Pseudomonas aeruginosa]RUH76718.1 alpha/beta fold hydrolase [Pseudomonas aeruginosa]HBO6134348.1 alpha/beta fold hydrolase [Pseudomonas aeruginosa]
MGNLSFLATSDGASLAYRLDGAAEKPLLALSNSIGTTLHMWDAQLPALTRHFRVLRYDARGHGASSVPPGPYTLARLGEDVLELLDALEVRRAHFLGLSLGGIVGQWLALHAPQRIERLVLANTSAWLGPAAQWDERIAAVLQAEDMSETAAGFLGNWFPPALLERAEPVVERFRDALRRVWALCNELPEEALGCFDFDIYAHPGWQAVRREAREALRQNGWDSIRSHAEELRDDCWERVHGYPKK